jgi:N-acetylglutamate synthase-like GNAT family acetyltransferase
MSSEYCVRSYHGQDYDAVVSLFEAANGVFNGVVSKHLFSNYMRAARAAEIDRIGNYYAEHGGQFWVVERDNMLVGMVGFEATGPHSAELRRLYVHPANEAAGLGKKMLSLVEQAALKLGKTHLVLATSSYQARAVRLYERSGYVMHKSAKAHNPARGLMTGEPRLEACKALTFDAHNANFTINDNGVLYA